MSKTALSRVPLVRLLIPFVAGILLADIGMGWAVCILLFVLGLAGSAMLLTLGRSPQAVLTLRRWWLVAIALLAVALGGASYLLWRPTPLALDQVNGKMLLARVDGIEARDFSMRLKATLLAADDQGLRPQLVQLSTRGCNYLLREGNVVAFVGQLAPVSSMGNPDGYDRRARLHDQGIIYSQHLPQSQLRVVGHRRSLLTMAAACRGHLLRQVMSSSLQPDAKHLIAALMLGEDQYLSSEIRTTYSAAGIAHILALSGLHVGIIASLIWLLLFPMDYLRLKKLRLLLTIAAVWAFAFVTGLSLSVVRAAIMISCGLAAAALYRKSVAINALCLSGLLTLVLWPTSVFQAGFQLSYVTVASILLLQGHALPLVSRRSRLLYPIWSLICISTIAMLATVMLSAYYFNNISLMSVLSNVLILPVMPLLIFGGAIFVLLSSLGFESAWLNSGIEMLYGYMNSISSTVACLPGSHLSGIYVTAASVWIYYGLLACLMLWLLTRNSRWLLGSMVWLAVLVVQLAVVRWLTPVQGLMILNDYRSTPLFWHENGRGYVWVSDNQSADREVFLTSNRRLMAHLSIDTLTWIGDSITDGANMVRPPLAYVQSQRLLVASSGLTKDKLQAIETRTAVDCMVITRRYHGKIADLLERFPARMVILSGGLPADRRQVLSKECRLLSLPYHDIGQSGAWISGD